MSSSRPPSPRRIIVRGTSGAGKTWMARAIGEILGIEPTEIDAISHLPDWQERPREELKTILSRVVESDAWIIDGNYGGTMGIRFSAADTVIFLDFPRWLCIFRVIRRRLQYRGRNRPDMAPGCPEKIDWAFLKWVWGYRTRSRPRVLQILEQYRVDKRVITLRGAAGVRRFLREIASFQRSCDVV